MTGSAESQVIGAIFKKLVTRFFDLSKELKMQENLVSQNRYIYYIYIVNEINLFY